MGQQESLTNGTRHPCGLLPLPDEIRPVVHPVQDSPSSPCCFPAGVCSPGPGPAPPDTRERKGPLEKGRVLRLPGDLRNPEVEGGETQGFHAGNSPGFHGISHGPEQSPFILITLQNNLQFKKKKKKGKCRLVRQFGE